MTTPVDRLPIRYTPEGAENLRGIARRLADRNSDLFERLTKELGDGFPLDDPRVTVYPTGERKWTVWDPALDEDAPLEIDIDVEDADVDPLGFAVWGYVEFLSTGKDTYPVARFVCGGIRELRRQIEV